MKDIQLLVKTDPPPGSDLTQVNERLVADLARVRGRPCPPVGAPGEFAVPALRAPGGGPHPAAPAMSPAQAIHRP